MLLFWLRANDGAPLATPRPASRVTELARKADQLVSEVGSSEGVKQVLIKNGTWQGMTPAQQAAFMRQVAGELLTWSLRMRCPTVS